MKELVICAVAAQVVSEHLVILLIILLCTLLRHQSVKVALNPVWHWLFVDVV